MNWWNDSSSTRDQPGSNLACLCGPGSRQDFSFTRLKIGGWDQEKESDQRRAQIPQIHRS